MKSYTDIEQSKKLAEILPLESADVWWAERYEGKVTYDGQYIVNEEPLCYISFIKPSEINYSQDTVKDIPCWSLAALIEAMPEILIETVKAQDGYDGYYYFVTYEDLIGVPYKKELIDACYEMILRLHEEKLI